MTVNLVVFDPNDKNLRHVEPLAHPPMSVPRGYAVLRHMHLGRGGTATAVEGKMWDAHNHSHEASIVVKFNNDATHMHDIHVEYMKLRDARACRHIVDVYGIHEDAVDVTSGGDEQLESAPITDDAEFVSHREGTCHLFMQKARPLKLRMEEAKIGLSEIEVRRHMKAVLLALHHMHADLGLIHMDIKPDNLLIDAFGNCIVADPIGENSEMVGTPRYFTPELVQQSEAGFCRDTFALALTVIELLTAPATRTPWDLRKANNTSYDADALFVAPSGLRGVVSEELLSILRAMLRFTPAPTQVNMHNLRNPADPVPHSGFNWNNDQEPRPVAAQVLAHPYFHDDPRFNSLVGKPAGGTVESWDEYYNRRNLHV